MKIGELSRLSTLSIVLALFYPIGLIGDSLFILSSNQREDQHSRLLLFVSSVLALILTGGLLDFIGRLFVLPLISNCKESNIILLSISHLPLMIFLMHPQLHAFNIVSYIFTIIIISSLVITLIVKILQSNVGGKICLKELFPV